MDTEKVTRSARNIRGIAKGLMIWNIIGAVGSAFVSLISLAFLSPSFKEAVMKQASENADQIDQISSMFDQIGSVSVYFIISLLLGIFAAILFGKISKAAKIEELPNVSWLYLVMGIHVYSIVQMIVQAMVFHSNLSIDSFVFPGIIAALLIWMYICYMQWMKESGGSVRE